MARFGFSKYFFVRFAIPFCTLLWYFIFKHHELLTKTSETWSKHFIIGA
jgi:hypothetical protein